MAKIQGAESVEQATAQAVDNRLEAASTVAPNDLSERIDASLLAVAYYSNNDYPLGGVANFFFNNIVALDRNNVSEVLKDIDQVVKKFKDTVLRERIKMRRRDQCKELKNEVGILALDLALTETSRERVGTPRNVRPYLPAGVCEKYDGKGHTTAKNTSYRKRNSDAWT